MSFSTYLFVFAFLPLCLLCYFALSKCKNALWQKLFLLAASLVFYAWANPWYLAVLFGSGVFAYLFAYAIQSLSPAKKALRKSILIVGIVLQIALLGYFKYYNFFAENVAEIFGSTYTLQTIILPLGISFFTFQQLMLLISVYQEKYRVGSVLTYALFISFFPYRVSGPIADYGEMAPQFMDEQRRRANGENLTRGLYLFVVGLAKKLVLADTLGVLADNGFSGTGALSLPTAWVIALAYTFQLYFDFSGYSDMAIGVAKMLNFDLPQNFDSPYRAESCTVFWRRWHMTLGKALTTCVYIPLGGNRKGKARTLMNLFLVFCVSGIWHGANWTFILWGVAYGLLVVFERVTMPVLEKIPRFLRIAGTFLVVNALWVVFRAPDLSSAMRVYTGMVNVKNLSLSGIPALTLDGIVELPRVLAILYALGFLALSFFICFCFKNAYRKAQTLILSRKTLVFCCLLFLLSVVHLSRLSTFIYVNF